MADLGTIDTLNTNRGTRPVDRTSEVRALRGALDATQQVAEEAIKADVTGDMVDAIAEVADSTRASDIPLPPAQEEAMGPPEDPRQAQLRANLDRWKLQAEQGNASQRTLAEMRIKEILTEAQNTYPWMREDLQRRAGNLVAGSAELDRLGMLDTARRVQASQAGNQLKEIQDYATKKWEDGGLGISPDVEIGTPRWLAEYTELDKLRQEQQRIERTVSMTMARAESSATDLENAASTLLQGKYSTARAGRHEIFSNNGFDAALNEVLKGDAANFELIRQFSEVGVPVILDELETQKVEAIQLYSQFFQGRLAGTEAGLRVKAQLDDFIQEQDSIISQFKSSVEDMPSAIRMVESLDVIRRADIVRGLSESHQNFIAFLGGPDKLIEVAKLNHKASGIVLPEHLGTVGTSALQEAFPTFVGPTIDSSHRLPQAFLTSGQGTITPDMTSSEVNNQLRKIQRDANDPWLVNTTTDEDELVASFWSADNHTKIWDSLLSVPETASPEAAANYMSGVNNSLIAFNAIKTKPEEVSQIIRSALADPRLMTAIEAVGDNGNVVNQRRAFGMSAKEWYTNTNPRERRDKALHAYNTVTIGEERLADLVRIDINAMTEEGAFAYQIDPKVFKVAVDNLFMTRGELNVQDDFPGSVNKVALREEVRENIINAMDLIAKEVNESITIAHNLDAATAATADTRRSSDVRLQFFDDLGWLNGFAPFPVNEEQ